MQKLVSLSSNRPESQRAGQIRFELTERIRCVGDGVGSNGESWHGVDEENCRGGEQREEGEEMHCG
jgi:hypothetical protein